MAAQSILARLGRQSGPMHELFESGIRFEGLRLSWYSAANNTEMAKECRKRQRFFERALEDLWREQGGKLNV